MTQSDQLNELAAALAKAQGQVKGATKDAENPYFKSRYADLASVWEACREALSVNGLAVVQFPESGENRVDQGVIFETVKVVTILLHSSGQWMQSECFIPVTKSDAQGYGSAITYGRRYALAAAVGVAPEDDDGEGAVGRSQARPQTSKEAPRTPKSVPVRQTVKPETKEELDASAALKRFRFICGEMVRLGVRPPGFNDDTEVGQQMRRNEIASLLGVPASWAAGIPGNMTIKEWTEAADKLAILRDEAQEAVKP